jgi:hypothetical protein
MGFDITLKKVNLVSMRVGVPKNKREICQVLKQGKVTDSNYMSRGSTLWSRTWCFWTGICSKRVNEVLVGIVGDGRQLKCCAAYVMTLLVGDNFG